MAQKVRKKGKQEEPNPKEPEVVEEALPPKKAKDAGKKSKKREPEVEEPEATPVTKRSKAAEGRSAEKPPSASAGKTFGST